MMADEGDYRTKRLITRLFHWVTQQFPRKTKRSLMMYQSLPGIL
jgi:hypothetical protein